MSPKNPETLQRLIGRLISRRRVLEAGCGLSVAAALPSCAPAPDVRGMPQFASVTPTGRDAVTVAHGYRAETIVRWGDPLFSDTPALDPQAAASGGLLEPGAARAQARQFGYNCDGIGVFAAGSDRLVLCVNNEFPSPDLLFPGWAAAARERRLAEYVAANPECVPYMQAAVGVSIIELVRDSGRWKLVADSRYNRRLTAGTPMHFSGPASEHRLLGGEPGSAAEGIGTFANCAAGVTPWGTYLTAEENVQDYFGNGGVAAFDDEALRIHERFGLRRRTSAYGWEFGDARFDLTVSPHGPFGYGWIVEIDPFDPGAVPRKLTALGRFRHEGATTVVAPDGRVVVYMGDDEAFEYFYKFVSRRRVDPDNPAGNRGLLDDGVLYVAKLADDGTGEWLPLVWEVEGVLSPANGFGSQADVVLNCRGAADLLQATPLDRPEDCAVDPGTGRVYLACTENAARGGEARGAAARRGIDTSVDAASPRVANRAGHILEFREAGGDPTAQRFGWEIVVIAGTAAGGRMVPMIEVPMNAEQVYFGGITQPEGISSFANPDNLAVDRRGNLWIVTDGIQPHGNNGCFVCALDGPLRGAVRQFMEGPVGAEICGCEFTADERTLFLTVQHPGSGGLPGAPISSWPDGPGNAPRPSLVAIESEAPGVRVGEL
jgi:secreted PhoX family phosphatase